MGRRLLLLALVIVSAFGCGAESQARDAVRARLKDPDSAKFGTFLRVDDNHACLTVNAKNGMGGYTGDQQAMLDRKDGKWTVTVIMEVDQATCARVQSQVKP